MEVVIALGQATKIHSIKVGSFQSPGAFIFSPKKMEYFVSSDGVKFEKVAEVVNEADSIKEENQVKDFTASFGPITTSFVKVVAQKGQAVERQPTWIFVDEIVVE